MLVVTQLDLEDVNYRFDRVLVEIFGIGRHSATRVFAKLGLNKFYNFYIYQDSTEELLDHLIHVYFKFVVGLQLKKNLIRDTNKINSTNNWRAQRASLYLPTRGQRTRSNALTQKSKRNKQRELDPVAMRIAKNMERRSLFFAKQEELLTKKLKLKVDYAKRKKKKRTKNRTAK